MQKLLLLSLFLTSTAHAAPAPCGGLELVNGRVMLGDRLALDRVTEPAGTTCLAALATALSEREALISVTITARTPNDKALREKGLERAKIAADKLSESGLDRARISILAPTGRADAFAALEFSYIERRPTRSIAQVQTISGRVDFGHQVQNLLAADPGRILTNGQWLMTGKGSVSTFKLLDDTLVTASEDTLVRVEDMVVEASGRRKGSLYLERGELHILAATREGPLHVMTPNAVAVVRGEATYRIAVPPDGRSHVEALDGTVVFGGRASNLFVPRGKASRLDKQGRPDEPHPLLVTPLPIAPLFGALSAGDLISWKPVAEARRYRVELAKNAQFTDNTRVFETTTERLAVPDTLPWGKWFWRVTPIDVDGVPGYSSKIYSFENRASR
jgi:hypothetical protein